MAKRWLAWGLAAAVVCCGAMHRAAAETVYLRVIARDDSEAAQAEKIRVRDAVTAACPDACADAESLLPAIRRAAGACAPCAVEIRSWTPGGGVPPAPTVYITLGPGEGHNWWGVLYRNAVLWARTEEEDGNAADEKADQPPSSDAGADESADSRVEFVWPLLDWLLSLLGIS